MKLPELKFKVPDIDLSGTTGSNIVLLGVFLLIAVTAFPNINLGSLSISEEGTDNNEPDTYSKKQQYIQKTKKLITANNYSVLKTLYKVQSIMDDISTFNAYDFDSDEEASINIMHTISSMQPFMSASKSNAVNSVADNLERTKKTIHQVSSVKSKISGLPEDTPKGEKIKLLINEIPSIAGIPILENIGSIKTVMSLLQPSKSDSMDDYNKVNDRDLNTDESYDDSYNELFELVELLDNNNKKNK